jgi:O-antigen/teichoic acid export membrane protein/rubredoxin
MNPGVVVKKFVRCKACGYIMEEGKVGDRCPACGAPRAAFEPYNDPMSSRRRNLLKLELHPVAVHFPISLTVAVLVLMIIIAFLSGRAHSMLADTVKILVLLIPALVIMSGIVGIIDGKIRFRKIRNSTILKKKIVGACVLFLVLTAQTVIIWTSGFSNISIAISAALAAIAVGVIVYLALLGTSLMEAAFPGN